MEFLGPIIILLVFVALGLTAIVLGVDSRDGYVDDHRHSA